MAGLPKLAGVERLAAAGLQTESPGERGERGKSIPHPSVAGGEPMWGVPWPTAMGSPVLAEKTLKTTNWSEKTRGEIERRLANASRPSARPGRGSRRPRHGRWPWTSPEFAGSGPTRHHSMRGKVWVNEVEFTSSLKRRTEAEMARIAETTCGGRGDSSLSVFCALRARAGTKRERKGSGEMRLGHGRS